MLKKGQSRHSQISQWLRKQIEAGRFSVDEKLPSENELAEKFEVSRVTVRRALQTLESEELIYRSQGLGSFVRDNRARQPLIKLTDFSEDMMQSGIKATSKVIRFEQEQVAEAVAGRLQVEEVVKVTRIDRLRLGDGEPVAFDITWLPVFYGQLLDGCDLQEKTIYSILEEAYDIPVERGCYRFQAENADDYLAEQLNVDEGTALLLIERQTYTVNDKPVYYQKRYYRSDKVVYELLMQRKKGDDSPKLELPFREFSPVFKRMGES